MTRNKTKDKLIEDLKETVEDYLNEYVSLPAFETCENGIVEQKKMATCLLFIETFVDIIHKHGSCIDKEFFEQLSDDEKKKHVDILDKAINENQISEEALSILQDSHTKKILLPYLGRELNWVVVSILSASYISAFIIMRSIFKLLIGIAIRNKGSMKLNIKSISFLTDEEQDEMEKLWNYLNGWSHPYGRWIKEVCPTYVSLRPRYHPKFCNQAVEKLIQLTDFFLVIGLEKFEISKSEISDRIKDISTNNFGFPLFQSRI